MAPVTDLSGDLNYLYQISRPKTHITLFMNNFTNLFRNFLPLDPIEEFLGAVGTIMECSEPRISIAQILNDVDISIHKYGYAVVTMHPQTFSKSRDDNSTDIVDEGQINET
jgi:hypothetical protein